MALCDKAVGNAGGGKGPDQLAEQVAVRNCAIGGRRRFDMIGRPEPLNVQEGIDGSERCRRRNLGTSDTRKPQTAQLPSIGFIEEQSLCLVRVADEGPCN